MLWQGVVWADQDFFRKNTLQPQTLFTGKNSDDTFFYLATGYLRFYLAGIERDKRNRNIARIKTLINSTLVRLAESENIPQEIKNTIPKRVIFQETDSSIIMDLGRYKIRYFNPKIPGAEKYSSEYDILQSKDANERIGRYLSRQILRCKNLPVIATVSSEDAVSKSPFLELLLKNDISHDKKDQNISREILDVIEREKCGLDLMERVSIKEVPTAADMEKINEKIEQLFDGGSYREPGSPQRKLRKHSRRMAELTEKVFTVCGYSADEIALYKNAALAHDIGKTISNEKLYRHYNGIHKRDMPAEDKALLDEHTGDAFIVLERENIRLPLESVFIIAINHSIEARNKLKKVNPGLYAKANLFSLVDTLCARTEYRENSQRIDEKGIELWLKDRVDNGFFSSKTMRKILPLFVNAAGFADRQDKLIPGKIKYPHIHEINTRALNKKFSEITDDDLAGYKEVGTNILWFMGVWEESPYSEALCKYWGARKNNIKQVASAYSIYEYKISKKLGGEAEFRDLVKRAESIGLKIMLDIVPNHMAADTPLLKTNPNIFMRPGPDTINENMYRAERDYTNDEHHACPIFRDPGTDEYFLYGGNPEDKDTPIWADTVQIDLTHPEARKFMRDVVLRVADLTDGGGIRFDQVEITFRERIKNNWFWWDNAFDKHYPEEEEFWKKMNGELKEKYKGIVLLAEAYEYSGDRIDALGFDFYYEKYFRKTLTGHDGHDIQGLKHFLKERRLSGKFNFIKCLENHDIYSRIKDVLGTKAALAAAVLLYTLPGASLTYHGQQRGAIGPVQTANFIDVFESEIDEVTAKTYKNLGRITLNDIFKNGSFQLIDIRIANRQIDKDTERTVHASVMEREIFEDLEQAYDVIAFERVYGDARVFVIVNDSGSQKNVALNANGRVVELSLEPWGYEILEEGEEFLRILHDRPNPALYYDPEQGEIREPTDKEHIALNQAIREILFTPKKEQGPLDKDDPLCVFAGKFISDVSIYAIKDSDLKKNLAAKGYPNIAKGLITHAGTRGGGKRNLFIPRLVYRTLIELLERKDDVPENLKLMEFWVNHEKIHLCDRERGIDKKLTKNEKKAGQLIYLLVETRRLIEQRDFNKALECVEKIRNIHKDFVFAIELESRIYEGKKQWEKAWMRCFQALVMVSFNKTIIPTYHPAIAKILGLISRQFGTKSRNKDDNMAKVIIRLLEKLEKEAPKVSLVRGVRLKAANMLLTTVRKILRWAFSDIIDVDRGEKDFVEALRTQNYSRSAIKTLVVLFRLLFPKTKQNDVKLFDEDFMVLFAMYHFIPIACEYIVQSMKKHGSVVKSARDVSNKLLNVVSDKKLFSSKNVANAKSLEAYVYYVVGKIHMMSGNEDKACNYFERSIEADETLPMPYAELIKYFARTKKTLHEIGTAQEILEMAEKKCGFSGVLDEAKESLKMFYCYNHAYKMFQAGRYDVCRGYIDGLGIGKGILPKYLKKMRDESDELNKIKNDGLICLKREEYNEAKGQFEEILKMNPFDEEVWDLLEEKLPLLQKEKDVRDEEITRIKKCLEKVSILCRKAEDKMEHGELDESGEKYNEALTLLAGILPNRGNIDKIHDSVLSLRELVSDTRTKIKRTLRDLRQMVAEDKNEIDQRNDKSVEVKVPNNEVPLSSERSDISEFSPDENYVYEEKEVWIVNDVYREIMGSKGKKFDSKEKSRIFQMIGRYASGRAVDQCTLAVANHLIRLKQGKLRVVLTENIEGKTVVLYADHKHERIYDDVARWYPKQKCNNDLLKKAVKTEYIKKIKKGKLPAIKAPASKDVRVDEAYVNSIISGAQKMNIRNGISDAAAYIKKHAPPLTDAEVDLENCVELYTIDIPGNGSGISRSDKARGISGVVYAYGMPGEKQNSVKIYVTKNFFKTYLKNGSNTAALAEIIDHEYTEVVLKKTHREASARARFFIYNEKQEVCRFVSPFHEFYLKLKVKEESKTGDYKMARDLSPNRGGDRQYDVAEYETRFYDYLRYLEWITKAEKAIGSLKALKTRIDTQRPSAEAGQKNTDMVEVYNVLAEIGIRLFGIVDDPAKKDHRDSMYDILLEELKVELNDDLGILEQARFYVYDLKSTKKEIISRDMNYSKMLTHDETTVFYGRNINNSGELKVPGKTGRLFRMKKHKGRAAFINFKNGDLYRVWIKAEKTGKVAEFQQSAQVYKIAENGALTFWKSFLTRIPSVVNEELRDYVIREERLSPNGTLYFAQQQIKFGRYYANCKVEVIVRSGSIDKVMIFDESGTIIREERFILICDRKTGEIKASFCSYASNSALKAFGDITVKRMKTIVPDGGVYITSKLDPVPTFRNYPGFEIEVDMTRGHIDAVRIFDHSGHILEEHMFTIVYDGDGNIICSFKNIIQGGTSGDEIDRIAAKINLKARVINSVKAGRFRPGKTVYFEPVAEMCDKEAEKNGPAGTLPKIEKYIKEAKRHLSDNNIQKAHLAMIKIDKLPDIGPARVKKIKDLKRRFAERSADIKKKERYGKIHTYLRKARDNFLKKKYGEARKWVKNVFRLDKNNSEAKKFLAEILDKENRIAAIKAGVLIKSMIYPKSEDSIGRGDDAVLIDDPGIRKEIVRLLLRATKSFNETELIVLRTFLRKLFFGAAKDLADNKKLFRVSALVKKIRKKREAETSKRSKMKDKERKRKEKFEAYLDAAEEALKSSETGKAQKNINAAARLKCEKNGRYVMLSREVGQRAETDRIEAAEQKARRKAEKERNNKLSVKVLPIDESKPGDRTPFKMSETIVDTTRMIYGKLLKGLDEPGKKVLLVGPGVNLFAKTASGSELSCAPHVILTAGIADYLDVDTRSSSFLMDVRGYRKGKSRKIEIVKQAYFDLISVNMISCGDDLRDIANVAKKMLSPGGALNVLIARDIGADMEKEKAAFADRLRGFGFSNVKVKPVMVFTDGITIFSAESVFEGVFPQIPIIERPTPASGSLKEELPVDEADNVSLDIEALSRVINSEIDIVEGLLVDSSNLKKRRKLLKELVSFAYNWWNEVMEQRSDPLTRLMLKDVYEAAGVKIRELNTEFSVSKAEDEIHTKTGPPGNTGTETKRKEIPTEENPKTVWNKEEIIKNAEYVVNKLIQDMIHVSISAAEKDKDEKVILFIDEDLNSLGMGDVAFEIKRLIRSLTGTEANNKDIRIFLENLEIRKGKGKDFTNKKGKVNAENIIVVTKTSNLKNYIAIKDRAVIAAIDDNGGRGFSKAVYVPLLEVTLFAVGKHLGWGKETLLGFYRKIPNAIPVKDLMPDELTDLLNSEMRNIVIRLIPDAVEMDLEEIVNVMVRVRDILRKA